MRTGRMPLERFFIKQPPEGPTVRLPPEQAHHLRHVRRVKVGDEIVLFDGSGTDYRARVETLGRAGVTVSIEAARPTDREPGVAVTLAVSVVKQPCMARLVDSCTQLGVRRLIPMLTGRSVVTPGRGRQARWRRIAIEACKQCGRSIVPRVDDVCTFAAVLDRVNDHDVALIGSLRPDAPPLSAAASPPCRRVLCLVGPEGGFTSEEEDAAVAAGCMPVCLAKSILRTETAAAAALAVLMQADMSSRTFGVENRKRHFRIS